MCVRGGDLDSFQDIRHLPVYGAKNNLIGSWPTKHLMHHYNTLEKRPLSPHYSSYQHDKSLYVFTCNAKFF